MDEPVHGILGRDAELAEVESFIGSAPGPPSCLLLEGPAGIGKTTLWHTGVSLARARGHRVLSCRAAESEARLSYAALGDLLTLSFLICLPRRGALDAALLRAEVEGAPPDQRAVSVASLGVLRALAASGPVIVAIDDVQWLDVPSARVLAFVVRRLEDAPIRILAALRLGSGGDPLGLGRTGPTPSLHRVSIGPPREAMTRLLSERIGGDLARPVLLRLHRISGGNPLFALEIARALAGQGIRPAPGEPLPVPGDLQQLLAARLAALPSSAADGLLVVAAAAREEAGRHARGGGVLDAAAELLELARELTPPKDSAGLLRRTVEAAEYHFDAGDATHATALLEAATATARPGRGRARILLNQASISWLDLPRVQGRCEQALQEAEEDAGIRTTAHEHLAWVGIYRGDLAFAAKHASASRRWARRLTDPAIRAESLSTFAMVEFLSGRVEPVRRPPAARRATTRA